MTPRSRADWVLPTSMLLGTFAWSFIYVSLPFHIQKMSTLDPAATLRWTGWILGVSPLITVVTAPISGRLGEHVDPKRGFIAVQAFQGVGFLGMALARTLPEMLIARMLLGLMGAVSTFAFIMVGRSGGDVRRQVSHIQSGMTLGQVLGPAAGAVVAARIGFRLSFVLGAGMLWACSALVAWGVPCGNPRDTRTGGPRQMSLRELVTVCLVVLAGSTQIFFLAAILPQILPPLGVAAASTLEVGGFLLLLTGLAAALGAMAAPRLAELVGDRRAVLWFLLGSSLLLAALGAMGNVWTFGALRFLQVLCIAPVFPLAVAAIAQRASGEAIGFVNSARIGAAFVGPVAATTLLSSMPPAAVYLVLAALGVSVVPLVARLDRRSRMRSDRGEA
ncbi:MAG TPA: MFS transporter [Candidatus Deferrimicrobiaceae bacterium]|nr:MFS transporter [Candidatus Deferrimicrobiaceae bacterium]